MKAFLKPILIFLLASSCIEVDERVSTFETGEIMGYKPVYATSDVLQINFLSPQPLNNPGKIYYYNNHFFINERFEGVHIYNNYNPESPVNLGFIQIKGNVDIAIRDNVLFADNVQDLIAIDISNLQNPTVLQRIEDVIPSSNLFPPQLDVYFECPDPEKGVIVAWEEALLNNPKCRR